jgi:hypothetical protein
MPTMPTPGQVLDLPMQPNDADAATIRDYLTALLAAVWREGECFSGKRPFGNSCWEVELYMPLVRAGFISGTFDPEWPDSLDDYDRVAGDRLIAEAIQHLGQPPAAAPTAEQLQPTDQEGDRD